MRPAAERIDASSSADRRRRLLASRHDDGCHGVTLHSIIGDDRWSPIQGPSDGVVAVSSARIGGVQSELLVDAKHTDAQRDSNTVREVICILSRHAMFMQ